MRMAIGLAAMALCASASAQYFDLSSEYVLKDLRPDDAFAPTVLGGENATLKGHTGFAYPYPEGTYVEYTDVTATGDYGWISPYTQVSWTLSATASKTGAPNDHSEGGGWNALLWGQNGPNQPAPTFYRVDSTPLLGDATSSTNSTTFTFSTGAIGAWFQRTADYYTSHTTFTPPPVPEPETYALMLVGLAALGWRARSMRRR